MVQHWASQLWPVGHTFDTPVLKALIKNVGQHLHIDGFHFYSTSGELIMRLSENLSLGTQLNSESQYFLSTPEIQYAITNTPWA